MASVNGSTWRDEESKVTCAHANFRLSVPRDHKEPEILTLYPSDTKTDAYVSTPSHRPTTRLSSDREYNKEGTPTIPWNDTVLKKFDGKNCSGQTLLWLPGSGRHVCEGPGSYLPFTHITRTLHLKDALEVCAQRRIPPKNIITFSSIDSRTLPPDHPCGGLRVLWFSTKLSCEDEDQHDWYGNVEFAVNASILLERWKYSYMVEMMTTPTQTTSRILLTNTDFSSVLRAYHPFRAGGPWQVSAEGHLALHKCSRYRFKGTNRHPHIVEFLLDVNVEDEKKILQECQLSFKNHEEAQDLTVRHVCNRHQRAKTTCPSPFPRTVAASAFAALLQQRNLSLDKIPKLSHSAQQLYNNALHLGIPPDVDSSCHNLLTSIVN